MSLLVISLVFTAEAYPIYALDSNQKVTTDEKEMNGASDETMEYYWSTEKQSRLEDKIKSTKNSVTSKATSRQLDTPHYYQANEWFCGPASVQIVTRYVTGINYDQFDIAEDMGTTEAYGTDIGEIEKELIYLTGANYEMTNNSQYPFYQNMVQDINGDFPVIYNVDAYYLVNDYIGHGGHYIVGNGYDTNEGVYYYDPNPPVAGDFLMTARGMSTAMDMNYGIYYW